MVRSVRFLTDFADQAVIIPLVLAIALALFVQGWRRGAIVWLVAVGATFAVTLAFKLIFLGCRPLFGPLDVHSPSGHVAAATVVAGGLTALFTRSRSSILPVAAVTAIIIGISRVVLHMHSVPEVMIGAVIGLCGAAAMRGSSSPPSRLRIAPLLAVIVIVTVLFHGMHLPAEAAIRHTAYRAALFIPACRP